MTLNQRLKQDLKADRYNLGHLAKEASVSRSYLYTILSGNLTPSIHVATCLAMSANKLTNSTSSTPDMFMTLATQELEK